VGTTKIVGSAPSTIADVVIRIGHSRRLAALVAVDT
jgi:hypothetical protein